MSKLPHKHGPMLRRIRILVHCLRDILPQPRLLGKPLSPKPTDGVPPNLDSTVVAVDVCDVVGDDVGFLAETEGVFEDDFAFDHAVFGVAEAFFSGENEIVVTVEAFGKGLQESAHSVAFRTGDILWG